MLPCAQSCAFCAAVSVTADASAPVPAPHVPAGTDGTAVPTAALMGTGADTAATAAADTGISTAADTGISTSSACSRRKNISDHGFSSAEGARLGAGISGHNSTSSTRNNRMGGRGRCRRSSSGRRSAARAQQQLPQASM